MLRVHVAGIRSGLDAAANVALAVDAVTVAAADGAGLVVLPEYASRFDPRGIGPDEAESLDVGFVPALQEAARVCRVAVIAGTTIPGTPVPGATDPGLVTPGLATTGSTTTGSTTTDVAAPGVQRAVNAVVAIDASGELVGIYRKVHLYDAFGHRESDRFEAGPADAPPLLMEVGGLVVGVMTCYDLRFPESARRLVDAGAQVIAVPAAWAAGEHKADQWLTLLRARAVENTAYVIGAAQQGPDVTGLCVVVDPEGVIRAQSVAAALPVVAGLDPDLVAAVRERNPSLVNRRYVVVPAASPQRPPSAGLP